MLPLRKPVMLKAVLFDLDNTLLDRDAAFRECVEAVVTEPEARAELLRLDSGGHGQREALLQAWKRYSGTTLSLGRLGELIAERLRPDHGLLATLRGLSEGARLGVITNGGSEAQRRKFQAAGLDQVIPLDHLWVSAEVGMAKPDPGIFLLASSHLKVTPGECLFIGDHGPHDLAGAVAAGMRARLVSSALNGERLAELMREERGG
jgi:putative hydrolase of the HAD superfamily